MGDIMNEKTGGVSVNLDYYGGADLYCDGPVEEEILEIVKTRDKSEFDSIIKESGRWEYLYHLSELRKNCVEWLPLDKNMSVLEIGSGCGALTGAFAKKAGSVKCIELSKKRTLINAFRNKEFDNIEIMVGNFQDIAEHIEEKFDLVTLIGVLEYSESYIKAENPFVEMLKKSGSFLKEGGTLAAAIENRLGMKYWAGCKEDHVRLYYESIEGYTKSSGVKTFGRKELADLCALAGFTNIRFYYPYPDYKFADTVYSDDYLPKVGELGNNMRNFDDSRLITLDEGKAFDSVIKNGLFAQYANSFLVLLEK